MKISGFTARRIAHELTFRGIIDEEVLTDITEALVLRDDLHHYPDARATLSDAKVNQLIAACERLYDLAASGTTK